jgi:hypothetical protein
MGRALLVSSVMAALLGSVLRAQGAAPHVSIGAGLTGTSGRDFSLGLMALGDLRLAIERRGRGVSPVAAASASVGRPEQNVEVTCPLLPGAVCTQRPAPWMLSTAGWFGVRGNLGREAQWRGLVGFGGLRFVGASMGTSRATGYDGQSYFTALRGEMEAPIGSRARVLFALQHMDAPRVEGGMRITGAMIALRLR